MAAAPQAARRPRIVNPVNGSVYAIDPDIPADRQRQAVTVSGAVAGHRLILDKRPAGDDDAAIKIVPRPDSHVIALVDPGGRTIDRSEEHTSELQSQMRITNAVFVLKKIHYKQNNWTPTKTKSTN